tara:strand:+ start:1297 stop:2091 length:795 start_codon:yes stop_codon:yes gene_type:complete
LISHTPGKSEGTQILYGDGKITIIGEENFELSGKEKLVNIRPEGREIHVIDDDLLGDVVSGEGQIDGWFDFAGDVIPNGDGSYSLVGMDTMATSDRGSFKISESDILSGDPIELGGRSNRKGFLSEITEGTDSSRLTYEPGQKTMGKTFFDFSSSGIEATDGSWKIDRKNLLGNDVDLHGRTSYDFTSQQFKGDLDKGYSFYTSPADEATQYNFIVSRKIIGGEIGIGSQEKWVRHENAVRLGGPEFFSGKLVATYGIFAKWTW